MREKDTLTIVLNSRDYECDFLLDYNNGYDWHTTIDNEGEVTYKPAITRHYKITINVNRIIIYMFSLSKYFYGCNIYTLGIDDVRLALHKLENETYHLKRLLCHE